MPQHTIWISGPTGAGKSSLASILSDGGYEVIREEIPRDQFSLFLAEPAVHCGELQESIMRSRLERWAAVSHCANVAFDRSVDEDIAVFCRLHRKLGYISDDDYNFLRKLADQIQSELPKPDLIVSVEARPEILLQRMKELGHPALIVQSLELQLYFYREWLESRSEDLLRLDNSRCSVRNLRTLVMRDTKC